MSERLPEEPGLFKSNVSSSNINPRTTRGSDFTWFNTSGTNIIKTDYNNCTGDIKKHEFPWGIPSTIQNKPFQLQSFGEKDNTCNLFTKFSKK